jgi:hypothetical protein
MDLQAAGVAGGNTGRGSAAGSARSPRGRLPHPGATLTHAAGQKGNIVLSPRIDSKEPIPPGCVDWRAGTSTLFLLGSKHP